MNQSHQPALLADVARLAGVSISTASRAITGRTPVSAELRRKVDDAIAQLGYRPNAAAQSLVSGRRSMIAVLARNTLRYGYAATLQGVEEAARAAGYTITIGVVEHDDPREIRQAVDLVLTQPLAGAVVIEFDAVGVATLEALPSTLPVVAVAGAVRRTVERPHVFLDDEAGGRAATEYLLDLGHRTVHHVAIPATRPRSGRSWGWRRALQDRGTAVPPVVRAGYSPSSGYEAGLRVAETDDVTAVLAGNDEIAIGVVRALAERGRRVPEDVSVVGFDDQPFAEMWRPALTTVGQDFTALGRLGTARLVEWIESGRQPENVILAPELVVRESAAAPR